MALTPKNTLECETIMIGEHSFKRIFERGIKPEDVLNSVRNGEVIREYPDDKPYPSFLLLNFIDEQPLHVVVALNKTMSLCFVITVYVPDPEMWSKDFKNKIV